MDAVRGSPLRTMVDVVKPHRRQHCNCCHRTHLLSVLPLYRAPLLRVRARVRNCNSGIEYAPRSQNGSCFSQTPPTLSLVITTPTNLTRPTITRVLAKQTRLALDYIWMIQHQFSILFFLVTHEFVAYNSLPPAEPKNELCMSAICSLVPNLAAISETI